MLRTYEGEAAPVDVVKNDTESVPQDAPVDIEEQVIERTFSALYAAHRTSSLTFTLDRC
jgi:hypothetical protein